MLLTITLKLAGFREFEFCLLEWCQKWGEDPSPPMELWGIRTPNRDIEPGELHVP